VLLFRFLDNWKSRGVGSTSKFVGERGLGIRERGVSASLCLFFVYPFVFLSFVPWIPSLI
jgi:hypothetical protein